MSDEPTVASAAELTSGSLFVGSRAVMRAYMAVVDNGNDWHGVARQIYLPPRTEPVLPVKSEIRFEGAGKLGAS